MKKTLMSQLFERLSATDEALRDVRAENLDGSEPAIGDLLEVNTALFIQMNEPKDESKLRDWRVLYTSNGETVQAMRFRAEDMAHAIEQFENACSRDDVIVGALQEMSFAILPDTEHEFTMANHGSAWVTHRNLSINMYEFEDEFRLRAHALGREDEDYIESMEVGYARTALDALIDRDDDPTSIYQHAEGRTAASLMAHLAELEGDGEGIHDRTKSALGDLLT